MTDEETTQPMPGEELTPTDFNLEDEYKPEPLAPVGTYTGMIRAVEYESGNMAIRWDVVASGNMGILMADGESQVDGNTFFYRNWLPKPGDDKVRTKSGRSTKRQAKINMLKRFADDMKINMNDADAVMEAIANSEWIGLSVVFTLDLDTYEGVTRNVIKRIGLSDEDVPAPPTPDDDIPFS